MNQAARFCKLPAQCPGGSTVAAVVAHSTGELVRAAFTLWKADGGGTNWTRTVYRGTPHGGTVPCRLAASGYRQDSYLIPILRRRRSSCRYGGSESRRPRYTLQQVSPDARFLGEPLRADALDQRGLGVLDPNARSSTRWRTGLRGTLRHSAAARPQRGRHAPCFRRDW